MKRSLLCLLVAWLGAGCMTLEERMAQRTGCNAKKLHVRQTSWSPGHTNYLVTCVPEKKSFLCTDTPVTQTCAQKKAGAGS